MNKSTKDGVTSVVAVILCITLVLVLIVGGFAGVKAFNRYQRRADVHNEITVRKTQVDIAKADVLVAQQQANVRYAQSVGIRRAQDEIAKTLTPLYVQHEAIEASIQVAKSGGLSQVYIPSGPSGIPLVATTPDTTQR